MWEDPKIPGIVKQNYLEYLQKFETLVPFEVLLLRLDAAIPAQLPVLETLSKIFYGNAVEGRQRFSLSLHIVSKPTTLLATCLVPMDEVGFEGQAI
jgi:hypothetical protein